MNKIIFIVSFFVSSVMYGQEICSSGDFKVLFSNNLDYDSIQSRYCIKTIDTNGAFVSGTVMFAPMTYKSGEYLSFDYTYVSDQIDTASVLVYSIDTVKKERVDLGVFPLSGIANQFLLKLDSIVPPYFCYGLLFKSTSSYIHNKLEMSKSNLTWSSMSIGPISENISVLPYSIYPNPTTGLVTISSQSDMQFLTVKNAGGIQISSYNVNSVSPSEIRLDLSSQIMGIYSVEVSIMGQPYSISVSKL